MPMGGSSEDHQVSASSHNHWATQKAQCADKDKNAYPYSGPATSREPITQQQGAQVPHDLEGEEAANVQLQEAVDLWNMATKLGAVCDLEQETVINKIKDMEERDMKEVERLGTRSHTP